MNSSEAGESQDSICRAAEQREIVRRKFETTSTFCQANIQRMRRSEMFYPASLKKVNTFGGPWIKSYVADIQIRNARFQIFKKLSVKFYDLFPSTERL